MTELKSLKQILYLVSFCTLFPNALYFYFVNHQSIGMIAENLKLTNKINANRLKQSP